jgi:hypothetical protein
MSAWAIMHPWMTFWLAVFWLITLYELLRGILHLISRSLRSRNIRERCWPPPHLDADGDWKPKP